MMVPLIDSGGQALGTVAVLVLAWAALAAFDPATAGNTRIAVQAKMFSDRYNLLLMTTSPTELDVVTREGGYCEKAAPVRCGTDRGQA